MAIGRQEAVLGEAHQKDKDFQKAMGQVKSAVSGTVGIGIGVGTSFIASPVGGVVAGGTASTVCGVVLDELFGMAEADNLKNSGQEAAARWEDTKDANVELSQVAALEAAKAHGSPDVDRVAEWARIGTADGFNDASTNAAQMADDLETEIPN